MYEVFLVQIWKVEINVRNLAGHEADAATVAAPESVALRASRAICLCVAAQGGAT